LNLRPHRGERRDGGRAVGLDGNFEFGGWDVGDADGLLTLMSRKARLGSNLRLAGAVAHPMLVVTVPSHCFSSSPMRRTARA
jgi:hypothetical protein